MLCCLRLYGQARESQDKLTEARKNRDAEMELTRQASRHSMTWVSQELMKGRTSGEYGNYGERLYVEGMLEHEKKKAAVRLAVACFLAVVAMCGVSTISYFTHTYCTGHTVTAGLQSLQGVVPSCVCCAVLC